MNMATLLKEMAKMALKRMTSGFWENETNRRKEALDILRTKGADTTEAKHFFVANTRQQISSEYNKEDEDLYLRAKQIFIKKGVENALSALIDQDKLENLDDIARERYIFNLSAKLQEFRERFEREQEFAPQTITMTM